ncbi:MAG: O-antigen ligase family protein [Chitinophagales bacterium]|nr:O-antigen ligase family protein [Chitinophagales bacterium]
MLAELHIKQKHSYLYLGFAMLSTLCLLAAFYFEQKALLALPFVALLGLWAIVNFRTLYFFLLALIPLSIEFDVSEGLATDLPTEPLMMGFLLISSAYLLQNLRKIDFSFFKNPVMLFLILHLIWILFVSIFSTVPLFSFKFILAKWWYVSAFLLTSAVVLRDMKDLRTAFWCVFIPLSFTVVLSLVRHALAGFAFDAINPVLRPFYRNHVNYAAILSVFLPFVIFARTWYAKYSFKYFILVFSVVLFLVGIYFSYTRASYLAVLAVFAAYFIFQHKLTKLAVLASFVVLFFVGQFIIHQNHYLAYTPSTKTVSQHELGDLVDATFKAEDVSSMERIYRWIAAIHMIGDRPLVGFGPNAFVENYKNYTVFIFETWISDNQERSGVHNYFLMTAVEQGLPGLLIFIGLLVSIFVWGEKQLHQLSGNLKPMYMAVMLSMIALLVNLLFSDMIEVDKTGSFFFFNLALLILLPRAFKGLVQEKQ